MARKAEEKPLPKALACGMLRDGKRVLFLVRTDARGIGRLELPCTEVYGAEDAVRKLASEFMRQTGIDAEVLGIEAERRYNAGSRRRKKWVQCLVFGMRAKSARAKPAPEFSGFRWLGSEDAKKEKLGRKAEWLAKR